MFQAQHFWDNAVNVRQSVLVWYLIESQEMVAQKSERFLEYKVSMFCDTA
jgi:hypothetical protein